ncbi:hypothetical protein [Rossellomorea marisflavi]|uniref:hypothetical protein n=1 Tax=Rossellomorea marisflavi TaxID=189381 RepID=UPI0018CD1514|nr:hypothetical protein [Rossellomorea marisflavi]
MERSIKSALYAYMWEDDFKALDDQITEILDDHPSITGRTLASLQNVGGSVYMFRTGLINRRSHSTFI